MDKSQLEAILNGDPNQLCLNDISKLQDFVYQTLNKFETIDEGAPGLTPMTVKAFVDRSTGVRELLKNTEIMNIGHHAVLRVDDSNEQAAIYDPYPLKNGAFENDQGQVSQGGQALDFYLSKSIDSGNYLREVSEKVGFSLKDLGIEDPSSVYNGY